MSTSSHNSAAAYLIMGDNIEKFDVLGPTIQFLMASEGADNSCCIMRGVIAASVFVPLHSHADFETFVVVPGELEGVAQSANGFNWIAMMPGDVFHVPAGAKHAFRNPSASPAVVLILSTARMGQFFRGIGRSVPRHQSLPPPTSETVKHFVKTAAEYGYWLATTEENAAIGLHMPV